MNKLLWIIATLFMFVVNIFASMYTLGGSTTAELSDKFSTLITPAGFTFAIWSLIYLGILVVSFLYLFKKRVVLKTTYKRYLLSCLVNGLWIVAWHYQNLHAAMALMLILLVSLIMIDLSIKHRTDLKYYGIIRNIFLLYFGRIQIATLLMTSIYLIYQLHWINADTMRWPVLCLVLGGISSVIVLWKEKSIIPLLVFCWALFGIYKSPISIFHPLGGGIEKAVSTDIGMMQEYVEGTKANWLPTEKMKECERNEKKYNGTVLISSNETFKEGNGSFASFLGSSYDLGEGINRGKVHCGGVYDGSIVTYNYISFVNSYGVGIRIDEKRFCIPAMDFLTGTFTPNEVNIGGAVVCAK